MCDEDYNLVEVRYRELALLLENVELTKKNYEYLKSIMKGMM